MPDASSLAGWSPTQVICNNLVHTPHTHSTCIVFKFIVIQIKLKRKKKKTLMMGVGYTPNIQIFFLLFEKNKNKCLKGHLFENEFTIILTIINNLYSCKYLSESLLVTQ